MEQNFEYENKLPQLLIYYLPANYTLFCCTRNNNLTNRCSVSFFFFFHPSLHMYVQISLHAARTLHISNTEDGVDRQAQILDDAQPATVVSLGSSTYLQCFAYGYPNPTVTWWKEDKILPPQSDQYELRRDHSLAIFRVSVRSLGPYTCQAYNGLGKAASWTITLHAVGPAVALASDEMAYAIYLLPPPRAPPIPSDLAPELVTPSVVTAVTAHREFSGMIE